MERGRAISVQFGGRNGRLLRHGAGALVAATLIAGSLPLALACGGQAVAAESDSTVSAQADSDFSSIIVNARDRYDAAQDAYKQAQASYASEGAQAYALELHANILEDLVPVQRERSDEAARELYKLQVDQYGVVDMLLSSESIDEFIARTEYLDRITKTHAAEMERSIELADQIHGMRASIEGARSEAEAQLNAAKAEAEAATSELEAVYATREERAKLGRERAVAEMKAAIGEDDEGADAGSSDGTSDVQDTGVVRNSGVKENLEALDDGADWHMTEDEFVAAWAPRLDAYLAGSAMAGQGEHFARSAWRYCIDPRWSAAISNIESGKGAICIRPYNAWGWGAADSDPYNLASEWGSWEEAIDAHARGLSKGYGYTITVSGSRAYCPPNWLTWYNTTVNEMSKI